MREAKLLSIRKVTQDNMGKNTAGVDGVSKLNSKERLQILAKININGKASPIKRVWIPKPGKKEKRPLAIPTILDRIKQHLVKLALEPQWEAKFEKHCYGFRPGRNAQDAITQVANCLRTDARYILDADIRKCFDRINHETLVEKVNSSHKISKQLTAWLKAGILDPDISFNPITNEAGTPQGGIVSPLLANIALHGMEIYILDRYNKMNSSLNKGEKFAKQFLHIIRYADDFLIIHPNLSALIKIKVIVSEFLSNIDLELNEEKTKIRNSLNTITYNNETLKPGVEFLGVFFRLYNSKSSPNTVKSKGKTLKKLRYIPSSNAINNHLDDIRIEIKKFRGAPQHTLIARLNPKIQGWTAYYRYIHSTQSFNYCDHRVVLLLINWCNSRHRNMPKDKSIWKYFMRHKNFKWTFGYMRHEIYPVVLTRHVNRKIINYNKVEGDYSPYSMENMDKIRNF